MIEANIVREIIESVPKEFEKITLVSPLLSDNELSTLVERQKSSKIPNVLTSSKDFFQMEFECQRMYILVGLKDLTVKKIWETIGQEQLSCSMWIFVIKDDYLNFQDNILRFGLNSLIISVSEKDQSVYQYLGNINIQFGTVNWIHFWCGMESSLLHTASKVGLIKSVSNSLDLTVDYTFLKFPGYY